MNNALPAATSCAETLFIVEKTKNVSSKKASLLPVGLQGIIDAIDSKKMWIKSVVQPQK
jgi:hypothetical protein